MTSYITSLSIHGFRNLADVRNLNLKPLNVLVGGSGTGKSTLLQFFEMLGTVSRQDILNRYVIYHGGGNDQCFMGGQATPMITASIVVATEAGDCEYSLKLRYDPNDDRLVTDEARWRVLSTNPPVDTALAEKILQRLNKNYGGFWEDCFVFHFCSSAAEANANKRWDIADSARLRPDGGNLAPVLLSIKENELSRYQSIVRQIQQVFPDFGDFVLNDEYGRVLLHWKHRFSDLVIGPYLTSDGTLRRFFLVTLLNLPEDRWPAVLLLDEPELGLSLPAMELVAALIRRVAHVRTVLVATQSSEFAEAVAPEDLIEASSVQGAAQFERVPSADYLHGRKVDADVPDTGEDRLQGGRLCIG